MKQAIAVLFLLFSFPVFKFGWGFAWSAVKLRTGQPFYAGSAGDYTTYGAFWVGMGLLILMPSAAVLLKKDSKGRWLVLPLLLLLLAAVALPSNIPPGFRAVQAGRAVDRRMEAAAESLRSWSRERRQLPADDQELSSAIAVQSPALIEGGSEKNSRFARGGQPVPYRFVLVPSAHGPHRAQPPGDQPALLYCAISPDRQRFWLTATALPEDVTESVVMLERDGQLVMVSGEVPPQPAEPTPAPAPGKKAGKK